MGELTILIHDVSKCFKRYNHPADRLKELLLPQKKRSQEFWALRHIHLEVHRGTTLGIVGRNGSGKSTLLQIIVGTLTPTTGQVAVNGRISALLELGSGFNPEFTGRQNVFFNGQLLGLTQREVEERFDSIAAFADIGDFIDQPVKTYSSGMFMRLAFAVATSVEPDILVVDEALSVGDEAFQRKCFTRIQHLREKDSTVLFVSHSASHVVELCDEAVLLDRGELLIRNRPKLVLDKYHKLIYAPANMAETLRQDIRAHHRSLLEKQNAPRRQEVGTPSEGDAMSAVLGESFANGGSASDEPQILREFYDPNLLPASSVSYICQGAKIAKPHILTVTGTRVNNLMGRREYVYTYAVTFHKQASSIRFGMLIKTVSGLELGGASLQAASQGVKEVAAGTVVQVKFRFRCMLNPGVYFLNAGVSGVVDGLFTYLDRCIDVAMFRVLPDRDSSSSGTVDFGINPSLSLHQEIPEDSSEPEAEGDRESSSTLEQESGVGLK